LAGEGGEGGEPLPSITRNWHTTPLWGWEHTS
jgi:hypothetical protein